MAPSPPTPRSHPSGKRFKLRIATCIGLLAFAALAWGGYAYLSPDWRAERELKSAREASADADYERAKEHLEQLIRIRPKSAQGHFLLARTHRQTDDLSAARKHLKEAKHLGFAAAEVEIEDHLIEAQEYGPRGPIEKSLQSLVNIRHPSEKVILEGLVKGYQNAHLPVAAVKWLAIWIERYPDDWLPCLLRGEILAGYNFSDKAREDYLRVIELRPRHPGARRRLGRFELNARLDPSAAAGHFAVLLEVAPDDPEGLLGLAECRRMQGDPVGARGYLDRLLARQPDHAQGCLVFAALEAEAGRTTEALVWAKRAETSLPDEPDLHYRLGGLFTQLGQPDAAARHSARFDALTEMHRKTTEWILQLLKDPSNADLRYRIGAELLSVGRDTTGVAWLSSALLDKPDHRPTHLALAAHYSRVGDAERADEHRRLGGGGK